MSIVLKYTPVYPKTQIAKTKKEHKKTIHTTPLFCATYHPNSSRRTNPTSCPATEGREVRGDGSDSLALSAELSFLAI